jgi:hypothetical protein
MQRYQYWLQSFCEKYGNTYGDILAESRGGGVQSESGYSGGRKL